MATYDFLQGMGRRRADPRREQSVVTASSVNNNNNTNTGGFDDNNNNNAFNLESSQPADGGHAAHPAGRAEAQDERIVGPESVQGPVQRVSIDSGKMVLLVVSKSNHGGVGPVTVWVHGRGDVSCDGDYIHKSRVLDAGRRSYALSSWGGLVTLTFLTSEAECVYHDKTNTHGSMILNVLSIQNMLVLDETHSTGLMAANYAYSFGMTTGNTDAGAQCTFDAVFVDIAAKVNSGAVYVYPMESGMIPPHHPADFAPGAKTGLWVGPEFPDLTRAVDELMGTVLKGCRVVCYVNPGAYTRDQLKALAKRFDACFAVGEVTAHALRGHAVTFRGDPLTDGDQVRLLRPVDELAFAVRRHVFENALVAPHSIKVDETLNGRLLQFVPGNIRSGGENYNRLLTEAPLGKAFGANRAYAVVSFAVPDDLGSGAFPDMLGFAYCDTNNYVHCLFPEAMCKTRYHFVELGTCLLN